MGENLPNLVTLTVAYSSVGAYRCVGENLRLASRVARWFIFIPKMQIMVLFGIFFPFWFVKSGNPASLF
jgi:hypothetical protein